MVNVAIDRDLVEASVSGTTGNAWPFTRLAPEPGSPLLGAEAYPQTVVLGPDNEVVGSFIGFDDYAQHLAEAGVGS